MKSWECDAPGMLGKTIGSSGSRWLKGHSAGNSATLMTWMPGSAVAAGLAATPAEAASNNAAMRVDVLLMTLSCFLFRVPEGPRAPGTERASEPGESPPTDSRFWLPTPVGGLLPWQRF